MQLLRLRGALVPHAPLLLPEVSPGREELRELWNGLGRIRIPEQTVVVVLTPHSSAVGVYADGSGTLGGFGLPHLTVTPKPHPGTIAGLPRLEGPVDHGAVVPLLVMGIANEVVVVGLGDGSDTQAEQRAVDAVRAFAGTTDTFVLTSAHTSARLTERAPLPFSFDAVRLDARFVTEVEDDPVAARDLAGELWSVGDTCSRSTLRAFGTLFAGARAKVLAYGSPFGVGYPVITAETDV